MNHKIPGLIVAIGLIVFVSLSFYSGKEKGEERVQSDTDSHLNTDETPIAHATTQVKRIYDPINTGIVLQKYDIHGTSMEPTIHNGETVEVNMNYYNQHQHEVVAGDVVVFENPFSLERIIKRVYIIPGDTVEKDQKNRTLLVNGKVVKNPVGVSYIFDDRAYKWIDIYSNSGVIIENTYFLFGDNVFHSFDSRQTGPVTLEGILGKKVGKAQ